MDVYLIVHSQSPFLILSNHGSLEDGTVEQLLDMGLEAFLVYRVPSKPIQKQYEEQFRRVAEELDPAGDVGILDAHGVTVMENVDLDDFQRVYAGNSEELRTFAQDVSSG